MPRKRKLTPEQTLHVGRPIWVFPIYGHEPWTRGAIVELPDGMRRILLTNQAETAIEYASLDDLDSFMEAVGFALETVEVAIHLIETQGQSPTDKH